jgi:hypothetical protein
MPETIDPVMRFVAEHDLWWLLGVAVVLIAIVHTRHTGWDLMQTVLVGFLMAAGAALFVLLTFNPARRVPFDELLAVIAVYGSGLYATLWDLLRYRYARRLTLSRGDRWIKEMDYPYLVLGTIGLLLSINKLDVVSNRITSLDVIGPIVVITAVVIRLIKTRADIARMNNPDLYNS